MIRNDFPGQASAHFIPSPADVLDDELLADPAQDEFFDRWLFDFRQSLGDFRAE